MKLILKRFDITIESNLDFLLYPRVVTSFIHDNVDNKIIGTFVIDERYHNTIKTDSISKKAYISLNNIERIFYEFKRSNFMYGNFIEGSDEFFNIGSSPLLTKDFLEFLKSEERDSIINKILEK